MSKKLRIITFDLETSPIVGTMWGVYQQFISIDNILKDWYVPCAAWRVLGEKTVHAVATQKPYDDYKVVKACRDVLATADLIVTQNGDKFDMRKLNARMIYHGIDPLPPIPTVDTKKEAKRVAAFTSNKLDYLGKFLFGIGKTKVDYELWLKVMAGDKKALKEMVAYNKVDVENTELLYLKLRPYMRNHPHVGVMGGDSRFHSCPNCGSTKLKRNGTRPTKAGVVRQEIQCGKCGSYHRIPIGK